MPTIIVHQSNEYSKDTHFNIPMDLTVDHTASEYIDRDGWIIATAQFSKVCVTSPVNNTIIFFYGNDNQFGDYTLLHIGHQKSNPLS